MLKIIKTKSQKTESKLKALEARREAQKAELIEARAEIAKTESKLKAITI